MRFPTPLIRGTLERRYKRFLADVSVDEGTVVAHCANSGSMLGVKEPGSEVWLSRSANPGRKLAFTWELIRVGETLVGINTAHPNALVAEAVAGGRIPELAGYDEIRREVAYGVNSRIDLLLKGAGRPDCYVEVKNVTLKRGTGLDRTAEFPDAVTTRGAKHLEELTSMVSQGRRAVMVYLVQRMDCERVSIAADIDPAYDSALRKAIAKGVEAICYSCTLDTLGIAVDGPLPLVLRARAP
ncbi:MAG: DNA/RNA nuclease SfsA [Alphaproteobacteria bacterium]|nr:DNA/RNA nuclease SfsA [Alphaproteobacteria bacterium]